MLVPSEERQITENMFLYFLHFGTGTAVVIPIVAWGRSVAFLQQLLAAFFTRFTFCRGLLYMVWVDY